MKILITISGKEYAADLSRPLDISIKLKNGEGPNCYFAPPFKAEPVRTEHFTGTLESGFPVNFYNLQINPHGNGTHTECAGHVNLGQLFINERLSKFHFPARVISVSPELMNGDQVITGSGLPQMDQWPEALIFRSLPNTTEKLNKKYSGTNPPYFDPSLVSFLAEQGVRHILTDLPSLDREEDGGKLQAHHAFWGRGEAMRKDCTVTELIFVPEEIQDGLYLLNLQVLNLELDASPSRPVIYHLEPITKE